MTQLIKIVEDNVGKPKSVYIIFFLTEGSNLIG